MKKAKLTALKPDNLKPEKRVAALVFNKLLQQLRDVLCTSAALLRLHPISRPPEQYKKHSVEGNGGLQAPIEVNERKPQQTPNLPWPRRIDQSQSTHEYRSRCNQHRSLHEELKKKTKRQRTQKREKSSKVRRQRRNQNERPQKR